MSRHLSDERLLDICLLDVADEADLAHLRSCPPCDARRSALDATLDETATVAAAEADAVFPPDRLARQRQRILQEILQDGRPAAIIAFPVQGQEAQDAVRPSNRRKVSRWGGVAAAVAASFVIGLLAEHLAHDLPGQRVAPASAPASARAEVQGAALAPALRVSDDEFLGQVELATSRVGSATLVPLDTLTPRAWEVR